MGQGGRGGLFEQAKYMVGYAKIFSDFIESPEFLDAMLHKLVDIEIDFAKAIIDECGEYFDWIRLSPEPREREDRVFSRCRCTSASSSRTTSAATGRSRSTS